MNWVGLRNDNRKRVLLIMSQFLTLDSIIINLEKVTRIRFYSIGETIHVTSIVATAPVVVIYYSNYKDWTFLIGKDYELMQAWSDQWKM